MFQPRHHFQYDTCTCCDCSAHTNCISVLNPRWTLLLPLKVNELLIGPIDSLQTDCIFEIKERHCNSFKIVKKYVYPNFLTRMITLTVITTTPHILKPGELVASLCTFKITDVVEDLKGIPLYFLINMYHYIMHAILCQIKTSFSRTQKMKILKMMMMMMMMMKDIMNLQMMASLFSNFLLYTCLFTLQTNMNCSACIENPKLFLVNASQPLEPQKHLPPIYNEDLLGNFHNFCKYSNPQSDAVCVFRCFATSHLEYQCGRLSIFSNTDGNSSNNT
jgi:hypothetical protein